MSAMAIIQRQGDTLDKTDALPKALRDCVHEFGYSVVHTFVQCGVTHPNTIRHLIHTVYKGAREPGNKRPAAKGHHRALDALDDYLLLHEGTITGRSLIGLLREASCVVLPREPTPAMVGASIAALSTHGIVTYEQKHLIRLRAAIREGEREAWPFLDNAAAR